MIITAPAAVAVASASGNAHVTLNAIQVVNLVQRRLKSVLKYEFVGIVSTIVGISVPTVGAVALLNSFTNIDAAVLLVIVIL